MLQLTALKEHCQLASPFQSSGRVIGVRGVLILARMPQSAVGNMCYIALSGRAPLPAQVISFQDDLMALAPFDEIHGLTPGAQVHDTGAPPQFRISSQVIGKILDPLGRLLSDPACQPPHLHPIEVDISAAPPNPLERAGIDEILTTGVRSIDGLLTLGYGQRIGLFAPSGAGKSTLLAMLARNALVDITVIGLVGERGREVNDFLHKALGQEALARTVVICATSEQSALRRVLAAQTATAVAEYFRARKKRVLLLIDSLTRVARAMRDVGLAAGEVPVRQGYTPSVYALLPKLLERAGNDKHGSITGIYTVLTNNEQDSDPLSDELKSLLDGHLLLDSSMAQRGIRPALDPLNSVSRLAVKLHPADYLEARDTVLAIMARLRKDKDMLIFGGVPDPELKAALHLEQPLLDFLNQAQNEKCSLQTTLSACRRLAREFKEKTTPVFSASNI